MNPIESRPIRNGPAGIRDTLQMIHQMALAGSRLVYVQRFILTIPMHQWDGVLRQYWDYQEEDIETLRSVRLQVDSLMKQGKLIGDCDDAAIVAGACCAASHLPFQIVAVRPPNAVEFNHVFVETLTAFPVRLDPTAPVYADYSNWERMVYP